MLSKLSIICVLVLPRIDSRNSFVDGYAKIWYVNFKKLKIILPISLVFLPGPTTYLGSFVLYVGFLSNPAFSTKMIILYLNSLNSQAPSYLSDLVQLHVPCRELRSSADTRLLRLPSAHLKFSGRRAFFCEEPILWNNNLLCSLRHYSSAVPFKSTLKTSSGLWMH